MKCSEQKRSRRLVWTLALTVCLGVACALPSMASADTLGPITFDTYTPGNIHNQNGWSKSGAYDVEVENVTDYPAASGYGFGLRTLRSSDAVTTFAFGDQAFSPPLLNDAGETTSSNGGLSSGPHQTHFETSFSIGSALLALQPGMHVSFSPDRGDGARMSYLRFDDLADGIHVYFDDVTVTPPVLGTTADFNETDIATISRASAHTVTLTIDFVDGPSNDVVNVLIDGALEITGTTWEDYYRFDPEQLGGGNKVPTTDSVLFRESGPATPANAGNGYLIDGLSLLSSTPGPTSAPPAAGSGSGGVGGTSIRKCAKKKKLKKGKCVKKKKKKK